MMMRVIAAALLALLLNAGAGMPDEPQSGPQVGATLPGQFLPLNVNGPHAGEEFCLYCHYGNAPVVMVFGRKPSEGLAKLVAELERAAAASKEVELGACVILTDASRESAAWLGKLASDKNLKRVVLATIDGDKLKDYALSADVTVLLYSNRVVRQNEVFGPEELKEKAISALVSDVKRHFKR